MKPMARERSGSHPNRSADTLARGLGWFSIGLGLAEVLAPRSLTRALGFNGQERLVQAYGLREIATGVAILAAKDPTPWIWGRVGGDALDLATLAGGFHEDNRQKGNVGLALGAVAAVSAVDIYCASALSAASESSQPLRDYSRRTGFPREPQAMRGAAGDFAVPRDMRVPEALRPYA
jgi:hypothetical protein